MTTQKEYNMTTFKKGTTYLFKKTRNWGLSSGVEHKKQVRKLVFLRNAAAAARGGLKLFRIDKASCMESFTLVQLGDYKIEVA